MQGDWPRACSKEKWAMIMKSNVTRRGLLKGAGAAAMLGAAGGVMPFGKAMAKDTTVGFIYVGPHDDFGYNQAHAQGAAAVKKIPGVKMLEVEKVPEDQAVQNTMKNMIEIEGAKVIFPTSF